jgi:ferritin-like metal-binding protein YciE
MTLDTMHDLLIHQLRDLYSAERQILLVWPQLIERSSSHSLAKALSHHREDTVRQIIRLDEAFHILDASPTGVRCRGMEGLLVDALANAAEQSDPAIRDSGIIADAQRVEGYELAVYGTARIFAESLGYDRIVAMLEQTLAEEEAADMILAEIAEREVQPAAIVASSRAEIPAGVVGLIRPSNSGQRVLRITV